MGINKPTYAYLLQENGYKIHLEDGNDLFDAQGSGHILLEQQSIGCEMNPLMASILLFLIVGIMERLGG